MDLIPDHPQTVNHTFDCGRLGKEVTDLIYGFYVPFRNALLTKQG